jgi:hypothetical protein
MKANYQDASVFMEGPTSDADAALLAMRLAGLTAA